MIISALLAIVKLLLHGLIAAIAFADFPQDVVEIFVDILVYISQGFDILCFYCHESYLLDLFAVCLAVDAVISGYKFVMWILAKIPFLNISR